MNIIKFSLLELAPGTRVEDNWGPLVSCYNYCVGLPYRIQWNWKNMLTPPQPKKTGKRGYPKGVKRVYRGKAIREE